MMISARNRCPFTPNQWQELEHQALIFKYMVSGVPIPPELIFSVKRSLDSSLAASHLFPHHQPIGWGCFQVGFSRKTDPEPGRCRRTDGKKWRCSKEAYPDSKYCERHMHRGRNRSRKPVEVNSTSAAASTTTTAATMNNNRNQLSNNISPVSSFSFSPLCNSSSPTAAHNNLNSSFFYSHSSTTSPAAGSSGLLVQTNHTLPHHFLDSGTGISYSDKDYRYVHGTREGVDERSFFPESASGTANHHPPLTTTVSSYRSYPQTEYQSFGDHSGSKQHCFVLGTDINSSRPIKLENKDDHHETQKPVHQFFGDWTPRNTDSWLDLAPNSGVHSDS